MRTLPLVLVLIACEKAVPDQPVRVPVPVPEPVPRRPGHGFLGIRYVFHDGVSEIDTVSGPAGEVDLRPGDNVLSVDGHHIGSADELQQIIFGHHEGDTVTIEIDRDGHHRTVRPTLAAWPSVTD